MKFQLLLLFLFMPFALWAQDSTMITIKSGSRISDVLTTSDVFLYPQYKQGIVLFKDGTKAGARMNYNSYLDQMLFLNEKGDTMAVRDEKLIKHIALGVDTFYYHNGYIRLLTQHGGAILAVRSVWEVADIRKRGSHNRQAMTYAVTTIRTITDDMGRTRELVLDEDMVLRKKESYFFGDRNYHFEPAGKKSLLVLFPKLENVIIPYLNDHKINFHKRDDNQKLIQLIGQSI